MMTQRTRYSAAFKARMGFEALTGEKTLPELASAEGVHPPQMAQWKKHGQSAGPPPLRRTAGDAGAR
jgi:transposase-like protein